VPSLAFPSQRLPRYLTQAEVHRFFEVIRDLRDRTLFALVYHHGLRVGEVALLQRGDVDLARCRIVVKRLKGGAWTEQPLFSATAVLLGRHLVSLNGAGPDTPLFPGRGGPLRKRQIQSLFARYRVRAGLPRHFTCHSLRHSIATHLLDAGVSLEFVQDHLGHQSIRSTSIYARITDHHRAALFQRLEASPWIVQPWQGGGSAVLPVAKSPPRQTAPGEDRPCVPPEP
jgi:integrase/recombinase XerC